MIRIAVTKISCLLGKHPYKSSADTLKEIKFLHKTKRKVPYSSNYKKLEKKLKDCSFYNWFTRARVVTNRMRKIARSIINKVCGEVGIKYNKPYNWFAKERGVVQEPICIKRIGELYKSEVTDQQKRLRKKYERFEIIGAIDGICQGKVVEVKCRSCVLKETPKWELLQLKIWANTQL